MIEDVIFIKGDEFLVVTKEGLFIINNEKYYKIETLFVIKSWYFFN